MLNINFWMKDSGNCLSHSKGLNSEQIETLHTLKEGDRLILWKNPKQKETDSSYTLKVYKPKEVTQ